MHAALDALSMAATYVGVLASLFLVRICWRVTPSAPRLPVLPWLSWAFFLMFSSLLILDWAYLAFGWISLDAYSAWRKIPGRLLMSIMVCGAAGDLLRVRRNGKSHV